jgi:hypothetical protein
VGEKTLDDGHQHDKEEGTIVPAAVRLPKEFKGRLNAAMAGMEAREFAMQYGDSLEVCNRRLPKVIRADKRLMHPAGKAPGRVSKDGDTWIGRKPCQCTGLLKQMGSFV